MDGGERRGEIDRKRQTGRHVESEISRQAG